MVCCSCCAHPLGSTVSTNRFAVDLGQTSLFMSTFSILPSHSISFGVTFHLREKQISGPEALCLQFNDHTLTYPSFENRVWGTEQKTGRQAQGWNTTLAAERAKG